MLCKKTCQFMELNAFSASASKTASVLFVPNMSCIECIAALHPASFPPRSCKFPHAFVTSSFTILMATFPAILRSTSPTPIGHKPGFLSRGASLPAINFWSDAVCLMNSAIALRTSDVQLPNTFDVNIFLHPPASNLWFWPLLFSLVLHLCRQK